MASLTKAESHTARANQVRPGIPCHQENELLSTEFHPITVVPGLHRLFLEYCSGAAAARAFYAPGSWDESWRERPEIPAHWPELVGLLAGQNSSPAAAPALDALRGGAGVVVTGQQVGLFGGPLFTPFKAATALARARAGHGGGTVRMPPSSGWPRKTTTLPRSTMWSFRRGASCASWFTRRRPRRRGRWAAWCWTTRLPRWWSRRGSCWATPKPRRRWPRRTSRAAPWPRPSRSFIAGSLPRRGCWCWTRADARRIAWARRCCARLSSAPTSCIAALLERNKALEAAGYHAQVAVAPQSSLLFLIDERTRSAAGAQATGCERTGARWACGRRSGRAFPRRNCSAFSMPSRSASRPRRCCGRSSRIFCFRLRLIVGGPAEIAYFAQSAVLYERILGRLTPMLPRFSATLIEPTIGELLQEAWTDAGADF